MLKRLAFHIYQNYMPYQWKNNKVFTNLKIYEYKNIKGDNCSEIYISD